MREPAYNFGSPLQFYEIPQVHRENLWRYSGRLYDDSNVENCKQFTIISTMQKHLKLFDMFTKNINPERRYKAFKM